MPFFEDDEERKAKAYDDKGKGKARAIDADTKDSPVITKNVSSKSHTVMVTQELHCVSSNENRRSGNSSTSSKASSIPITLTSKAKETELTDYDFDMAAYDQFFAEKGIDLEDIVSSVEQPKSSEIIRRRLAKQQGPKKLRKLGVGQGPRPVKSKEEKKKEEWIEEIEKKRDEMRNGPIKQYYSPILDTLCEYHNTSDNDNESD